MDNFIFIEPNPSVNKEFFFVNDIITDMNYRALFEHMCQIICTAFKLMCYNENSSADILNRFIQLIFPLGFCFTA